MTGNKFSKTYRFSDINYLVASREDKESMFLTYSELLNSLDSGAVTKITINNRRMNKANFENSILMPMQGDFLDEYRREYNQMLLDKAAWANGIIQEKYITISVVKKMWRRPAPTFPAWGPTSFPTLPPWVPSAWSWTLPKGCVSCTTSTARGGGRVLLSICPRYGKARPRLQGLYLPGQHGEEQRLCEAGR